MSEATHGVTTGAVARRLGVSPTTVRSWEQRYGIGPAVRASGRHRRWMPQDIALLEEMCRLTATGVPPGEAARVVLGQQPDTLREETPLPSAPEADEVSQGEGREPGSGNGLPLGDVRQECRGLARAAVRLDAPSMEALLQQVIDEHGLVAAWEEVMVPTLHAVGRKWESSDDRYVEVEHLLSWQVSTALRRAAVAKAPTAKRPPVVLACVPSEAHTLPLEALAAGLAERGLPVRMFGGAVPAEALDAAVRRSGPAVVVLWSQARSTASHALARHVAGTSFGLRGARTTPLVLLAGPGWAGPPPGDGLLRPGGLREALDVISTVYRDPVHATEV
ncbi:MerR family transcriptional regulator [Streptomyces tanashiensis]|uniref:MerR family transcriptional regulator n=1 Tax=Streptomyces tanashiensis TaxID=67367 RepID=A0ABY6RAN4_9ACTN|nr:MerR family transcriptional regulator [Streptomyces tanashiensis]UZX25994.1 MerR family transcriptional regulator [Streptomyces tanashiensis]GGY08625.1 transcriptional regulator [Streptomyces tanashiensis]